jgi:antitoxin ChpS
MDLRRKPMMTITLRKLGKSVVMDVPVQILNMMHIGVGTQMHVNVVDGKLVVEPTTRPLFTLAELIAQCDEENMALTAEDNEWLNANPVGIENI